MMGLRNAMERIDLSLTAAIGAAVSLLLGGWAFITILFCLGGSQ